ncbi:MAG: hypothetical protein NC081_11245 [Roseburia sp.]|nr:hypothetical protein [Roseburia sp.]
MVVIPKDERYKKQVIAGIEGRNKGHHFEESISDEINKLSAADMNGPLTGSYHIYQGNPAQLLISYIAGDKGKFIKKVTSYWIGGLATSNLGDSVVDGEMIRGSKSDILLNVEYEDGTKEFVGISVKACSNNAQMALTSATVFCKMLRENGISVSEQAEIGLKMFCGDVGFRPMDGFVPGNTENIPVERKARPERWYWEELADDVQKEWEGIFNDKQIVITMLLLQTARAYKTDKFKPQYILHECNPHIDINACEVAIISINEFAIYSQLYDRFGTKGRRINKGSYKGIDLAIHQYPYFGFIQFQPIGNKQNFSELQFNLMASYYKKFKDLKE